ncbi:MAG: bifunctional adenosylcobinamide kinase/adenosylcobinamide-phosphate guanylyltransferase [Gemmiger sp.]|nr:bifunctional adenosylcobinamide kinase/adenosylcobinamide-phosphate guanylyltransferase [Gemmiger sp.]
MFTLVIGGAGSGKSVYAETLALAQGEKMPRYYLATMQPFDAECRARIARHRAQRAEKGFITIECYTGLAGVQLPAPGTVLLECLGNLAANELYGPAGGEKAALAALVQGVKSLRSQCRALVVVTNEVGTGGHRYAGDTLAYLRLLGAANRALAAEADCFCEVCCGIPRYVKGDAPV